MNKGQWVLILGSISGYIKIVFGEKVNRKFKLFQFKLIQLRLITDYEENCCELIQRVIIKLIIQLKN